MADHVASAFRLRSRPRLGYINTFDQFVRSDDMNIVATVTTRFDAFALKSHRVMASCNGPK